MILWPIRFRDEEDTIRVCRTEILIQTPYEMARVYKPTDIRDNHVTQRERYKN